MRKHTTICTFVMPSRRREMLNALAEKNGITFSALCRYSVNAAFALFEDATPHEVWSMVEGMEAQCVAEEQHFSDTVIERVNLVVGARKRATA